MTVDSPAESTEARRKWQNILLMKNAERKGGQLRILYSMKILFRNKGKIKTFSGKEH